MEALAVWYPFGRCFVCNLCAGRQSAWICIRAVLSLYLSASGTDCSVLSDICFVLWKKVMKNRSSGVMTYFTGSININLV